MNIIFQETDGPFVHITSKLNAVPGRGDMVSVYDRNFVVTRSQYVLKGNPWENDDELVYPPYVLVMVSKP